MIHYALRCDESHAFDGWFASSAAFDRQCVAGLVECPQCGSVQVSRGLMAPAVGRPAAERRMPAEVRAGLQKLRGLVEKHCDYVGPEFAERARQMHRGELAAKAIYGETSPKQAEALVDEGIEIGRIPWIPKSDG